MKRINNRAFALVLLVFLFQMTVRSAVAQGTVFTYQGKFTDGTYDMQFKVFDTDTVDTGTQIGPTLTKTSVEVTNGAFTVKLDFGAGVFTGPARFLELGWRPAGSTGDYTIVSPREEITSSPYSIRSLSAAAADNATQLGGVASSSYVQGSDPRLSDARPPLAGSNDYIRNSTIQQSGASFNISGNGTAGGALTAGSVSAATVDAGMQYSIGGGRVLSVAGQWNLFVGLEAGQSNIGNMGIRNTFVGIQAGQSNTTGLFNSFFGAHAGQANTIGNDNSFFGLSAGSSNTTGQENSFFGRAAGGHNTTGMSNAFFGSAAGVFNTTGFGNSFFGTSAGQANTTAGYNSFFGWNTGDSNTTGTDNSFFGSLAGSSNTTGSNNTLLGKNAGDSNTTGADNSFFGRGAGSSNTTESRNTLIGAFSNGAAGINTAAAIGYRAQVTQSSSLVLGGINGVNGATTDTRVGIGTTAPTAKLTVSGAGVFSSAGAARFDLFNATAGVGYTQHVLDNGRWQLTTTAGTVRISVDPAGNVGIGTMPPTDRLHVNGIIKVDVLGSGGVVQLCRNPVFQIANCSSSLRYKDQVLTLSTGLNTINRLRPVTFRWKEGGQLDIGLVAEEVEKAEPLLVTYNAAGEVEGVKYDRINVLLVNAFKQQQTQIEQQQRQIDGLKKIVCLDHPTADICK